MTERCGILAGGNLLVDHVIEVERFPEAGTLVTMQPVSTCIGGAPLNVLISLAKMQVPFPLGITGILGQDEDASYILKTLHTHQIQTCHVAQTSGRTAHTYVMSAKDTRQRTFFHHLGVNTQLDLEHFREIQTPHKIFHLGYLLLLAGLDQPDDEFGSISARLFHDMQQKGYLTSLDLVSVEEPEKFAQYVKPCLPYVNYLIINEWEAQMLSGVTVRNATGHIDSHQMWSAAKALIQLGVKDCVVLHCPEGAWAVTQTHSTYYAASYYLSSQEIKGTVGAGDAFCAGMLYALHENIAMADALKIANACAYFNLQSANSVDGTMSLATVQQFIAKYSAHNKNQLIYS